MTRSRTARAAGALTALTALPLSIVAAGCDHNQGPPGRQAGRERRAAADTADHDDLDHPTGQAGVDYTRLLIQDRDISEPNDTYTAQSPIINPDGRPGAEVLLVNQNQTKAINVLLVGLPTRPTGRPRSRPSRTSRRR